jgi:hypothetical protein
VGAGGGGRVRSRESTFGIEGVWVKGWLCLTIHCTETENWHISRSIRAPAPQIMADWPLGSRRRKTVVGCRQRQRGIVRSADKMHKGGNRQEYDQTSVVDNKFKMLCGHSRLLQVANHSSVAKMVVVPSCRDIQTIAD